VIVKEHEWLGVGEYEWFQTRYAIRLPDGTLALGPAGTPWMWSDRSGAERAIGYFNYNARKLGVEEWNGEIVRQLCTPWIGENDNAATLVKDLSDWLAQQTGSGQ
jgi:hypothetical protein